MCCVAAHLTRVNDTLFEILACFNLKMAPRTNTVQQYSVTAALLFYVSPPFFLKKSRCTLMLQNIRYTKVETVTNVDTHPSSSSACFSLNTASRWRKPSMSKMQLYFTHLICNWKLKFIPLCALVCDHLDATLAACSHVCVVSKQSAENNGVVDRPLEIWHFPRRMSKKKRHCSGIAIRKSGDSDDVQWQWVTFNWRTLAQLL